MSSSEETTSSSSEPPPKSFCTAIRTSTEENSGIDCRDAILQNERISMFRGKDLVRFLRNHPAVPAAHGMPSILGGDSASGDNNAAYSNEKIMAMCQRLVNSRYFYQVERMYKKPRPGRKKLVKFPRKVVVADNPREFRYDGFYVWNYDLPTNQLRLYLLSGLVVVATIMMCLFPVAPYRVKLTVLYLSLSMLILLLGTLIIRGLVFAFFWMTVGWHLWIFPNLLDETIPFLDTFKPLIAFDMGIDGKSPPGKPSIPTRGVAWAFSGAVIFLLSTNGPSAGQVRDATKQMNKDLLDYLKLHDPKLAITNATNGTNATDGAVNATLDGAVNATNATNTTNVTLPSLDEVLAMTEDADEEEADDDDASSSASSSASSKEDL